jgi:hypothetical protein
MLPTTERQYCQDGHKILLSSFGIVCTLLTLFTCKGSLQNQHPLNFEDSNIELQTAFNETANTVKISLGYLAYKNYFSAANRSCGVYNPVFPHSPDRGQYHEEKYRFRPWSLLKDAFAPVKGLKPCKTVQDVQNAMFSGKRTWDFDTTNMSGGELELIPSQFIPQNCYLEYLSAEDVCEVLSKHFKTIFIGDSVLRHVQQGFWMSVTGDFVLGGIPRHDPAIPASLRDKCRCDGQFAETESMWVGALPFIKNGNIRETGMCPNLLNDSATVYAEYITTKDEVDYHRTIPALQGLCSRDPRPRVVVFQGGLHRGLQANLFIQDFAEPILNTLLNVTSTCEHKLPVSVIWVGTVSQSETLKSVFPNQAAEAAQKYDAAMLNYLETKFNGTGVNFFNLHYRALTANRPTSDGIHKLASVNLYAAQAILSIMKFSSSQ